jgi:transglutaminase-like putative cysteine protease
MHIRYGYRLDVACDEATTLTTRLDIHPDRRTDLTAPEDLVAMPLAGGSAPVEQSVTRDRFGNLCRVIAAPAGGVSLAAQGVIFDPGFPDADRVTADEVPAGQLPAEVAVFLEPSPACPPAPFVSDARRLFGGLAPGWRRVRAVSDHVRDHIGIGPLPTGGARTLEDVWRRRMGSGTDRVHLAIALCRSLGIPARFATGYAPDIGALPDSAVTGFSAWFEAYLADGWFVFDPGHRVPRIGRIVVAYGRDATDTPPVSSPGAFSIARFDVLTEEIIGQRFPVSAEDRRAHWSKLRPHPPED